MPYANYKNKQDYDKLYHEKHREPRLLQMLEYYYKNIHSLTAARKEYYYKNRGLILKTKKERYEWRKQGRLNT